MNNSNKIKEKEICKKKKIYVSHLVKDEDMKVIIDRYSVGIEAIEFGIGNSLDNKEVTLKDYKKRIDLISKKCDISIHGPFLDLCPGSFDSLVKKITMERFQTAYLMAKEVQAERIIFHTCFNPTIYMASSWENNSKTFWDEFLDDKDDSIKIHIENMYDTHFQHIASLIDKINHPAFSACFDIGHANCFSNVSLSDWINGLGERIGHIHLHNNNGIKDEHKGILNGNIDIFNILTKLDNLNKNTTWTLELNKYNDIIDSLEWLKNNGFL